MSHGGHKISLLFWKNTRLVKFWRFQTGLCHKQTSKQITLLSPNNNQITKTDQVYFFFHDGQEKHASSAWLSPSVCIVRCVTSHFPRQLQHKVFRVLFFVLFFSFTFYDIKQSWCTQAYIHSWAQGKCFPWALCSLLPPREDSRFSSISRLLCAGLGEGIERHKALLRARLDQSINWICKATKGHP